MNNNDSIQDYKLDSLKHQIEKLSYAVDRICDRIEALDRERLENSIKKRVVQFLFMVYPAVLMAMIYISNVDHQKISDISQESSKSLYAISEMLRYAG